MNGTQDHRLYPAQYVREIPERIGGQIGGQFGKRFSLLKAVLSAFVLVLMLAGCGNKGDLFQPLDKENQEQLDKAEQELDAAAKKKKKK